MSTLNRKPLTPGSDETLDDRLGKLWASALNLASVASDDDFFASGGDSVRAARLISWLRNVFGIELTIKNLSENPTPAAMARYIGALQWATAQGGSGKGGASSSNAYDEGEIWS